MRKVVLLVQVEAVAGDVLSAVGGQVQDGTEEVAAEGLGGRRVVVGELCGGSQTEGELVVQAQVVESLAPVNVGRGSL